MNKYNPTKEIRELNQKITNIISYLIYCREKGYISDKTLNEVLKICNPELYKEGANNGRL